MDTAIEFREVDILFAREPGRAGRKIISEAVKALDAGGTREEIAKKLGVVVGVSGANLCVTRGEISVLMGLSGSGKSTLLRAANGLNPITRGHVLIREGESVTDVAHCTAVELRRVRRERVAMVFQQFGLLPWRTVRENVGFGLELRGENALQRKKTVDEKLELVGLSQWADRNVSELSGGMQQRVGLARAFATDADILLMDEPFSALDPLIRRKLQDELLALQERVKKTIVFVSHDLDEALRLGDHITILHNGRIVQSGTVEDIVLAPADDYVAEFVRHMNPLSVLTGGMVMRPWTELKCTDGAVCLDTERRYQARVDAAGVVTDVRFDGITLPLQLISADNPLINGAPLLAGAGSSDGLAVVPAALPLQIMIQLLHATRHPLLLTEGLRPVGVCGAAEIIGALGTRSPR